MKIFIDGKNVYDQAIERLHRLFEEFGRNVVVTSSGGKDSTIVVNLSLMVAEERGLLPLKVFYLDQEVVYQSAVDYMREVMADPRIEPLWFQAPIGISNCLSEEVRWFLAWDPAEQKNWMREREPCAMTENVFGKQKWVNEDSIFKPLSRLLFGDEPGIQIGGVRTEESPARYIGLTTNRTYREITWGKVLDKKRKHFSMYPIFDWTVSDVWKCIAENDWPYCRIYDYKYQYGIEPKRMRVSSLIYETAIHSLFMLPEIEPETWDRLCRRVPGVAQAGHIPKRELMETHTLPAMFGDWKEYRDYLVEELVEDPETQAKMRKVISKYDAFYDQLDPKADVAFMKKQVQCILINDAKLGKADTFRHTAPMWVYRQWRDGKCTPDTAVKSKELWGCCPPHVQARARQLRKERTR